MLFFNLLSQFKSTIKTIFIAHYDVFCAVILVFLGHIALIAAISFWQNKTPLKNVVATSPEVILNLVAPIVPNKPVQPSVAKTKPITIPKVIRAPKAVTLPKTIAPPKSTNLPKTVAPPKSTNLPKTVAPPKPVDVPKPVNTITPQQLTTVVQAVAVTDTQKISDVLPTTIQPVKSAPNVSATSNAVSNAVVPSNTPSNSSSSTSSDTSSNNEVSRTVQTSVKTPVIFNADYLNNPTPVYPNISRLRGETGKVLLRVSVNRNGQAASIELHRSSGSSKLDEAAIRTVRLWNFVPAKIDGNPVDSTVIVPIDFKLD